jgi:hypothetical protein
MALGSDLLASLCSTLCRSFFVRNTQRKFLLSEKKSSSATSRKRKLRLLVSTMLEYALMTVQCSGHLPEESEGRNGRTSGDSAFLLHPAQPEFRKEW